jgi:7-carboxy-7-deazaguanine synthase
VGFGIGKAGKSLQRAEKMRPLLVSEIFSSIQGEGINLGAPSVFLRLAICNLHCWYCDTKYTWLYNERLLQTVKSDLKRLEIQEEQSPGDLRVYRRSEEAREMSIKEVESRIKTSGIDHLVVTGGEPMLQQLPMVPLFERLKFRRLDDKNQFYIEIETNGSIKPTKEILHFVDQWNVSPKLESSGNSRIAREKEESMKAFALLPNSYFKFVVASQTFDQDLREIEELSMRFGIQPGKILLMAEGTDASILKDRTQVLTKVCEKRGYRVTPRLHILLWGNRRGT